MSKKANTIIRKHKKVYFDEWKKGQFINAMCPGNWNGWENPKVTIGEVRKIIKFNKPIVEAYGVCGTLALSIEKGKVYTLDGPEGSEKLTKEEIPPEKINGINYYDVGWGFCWFEVE